PSRRASPWRRALQPCLNGRARAGGSSSCSPRACRPSWQARASCDRVSARGLLRTSFRPCLLDSVEARVGRVIETRACRPFFRIVSACRNPRRRALLPLLSHVLRMFFQKLRKTLRVSLVARLLHLGHVIEQALPHRVGLQGADGRLGAPSGADGVGHFAQAGMSEFADGARAGEGLGQLWFAQDGSQDHQLRLEDRERDRLLGLFPSGLWLCRLLRDSLSRERAFDEVGRSADLLRHFLDVEIAGELARRGLDDAFHRVDCAPAWCSPMASKYPSTKRATASRRMLSRARSSANNVRPF